MIAHKMTLELPATRSLLVTLPLEFAPGPVEVIILGREEKAPGVVTDAEGMSVEEFRKCFPEVPALSNGLCLHEDPTLPLASEDWGELAS
ncbi:MAG: hypothetical protein WCI05_13875 [Myxococcales bacterium]